MYYSFIYGPAAGYWTGPRPVALNGAQGWPERALVGLEKVTFRLLVVNKMICFERVPGLGF